MDIDPIIDRMLSQSKREAIPFKLVSAVADRAFERGYVVFSMEVFEVISDTEQPLRLDLSILGLEADWDVRAPKDTQFAREVLESKMRAASECANELVCEVWLEKLKPASETASI